MPPKVNLKKQHKNSSSEDDDHSEAYQKTLQQPQKVDEPKQILQQLPEQFQPNNQKFMEEIGRIVKQQVKQVLNKRDSKKQKLKKTVIELEKKTEPPPQSQPQQYQTFQRRF